MRTASIGLGGFRPLTLPPKFGVNVYNNLQMIDVGDDSTPEKIEKVYDDLWPCFQRYCELYHGERMLMNYKDQTNLGMAFGWMLQSLAHMLGDAVQFEIREERGLKETHYYFHAYAECFFSEQWQVIELGPTIKKLRRQKSPDLKTLILFLGAFRLIGPQTWFDGDMDWFLNETFNEEIYNNEDPQITRNLRYTQKKYSEGLPYEIEMEIKAAQTGQDENFNGFIDLDVLAQINQNTQSEPIKKMIDTGVELLREKRNIWDYHYIPEKFEDNMGLEFPLQFTLVWDITDTLSGYYEEHINVSANEGLFCPFINLKIDAYCDRLFMPDQFTVHLTKFFDFAVDMINEFLNRKQKPDAE